MQGIEVADGHFLQRQQVRREFRQRPAGVGMFQNAGEAHHLRQADIQRRAGQGMRLVRQPRAVRGGMGGDDSEEDSQYRKACQIVFESQKASTSWIQRQLRIGYNSAARLIDRMEEDGFISAPNHIGRREVLRDRNGDPI